MQHDTSLQHLPLCLWARPSAPPCVYFLADHLDAVLATGEDMREIRLTWVSAGSTPDTALHDLDRLREAVDDVRSLELTLIARLLKSRERAEELQRADPRLKLIARLFLNGTLAISDAVPTLTDITASDFETGDAALAYLRARELLAVDAAAPGDGARLHITEAFPIAGRLPLGTLMDLVAQFLDAIELHHDIYTDQWTRQATDQPSSAAVPAQEAATAMANKPTNSSTPPATAADAARAAAPPRKGYRSLTAALAELEEQEKAKQAKAAATAS
jgi:hypothetical protein